MIHFAFYKLRPSWWDLEEAERSAIGSAFCDLLREWGERLLLVSCSLAGIRADCDLMLWKAAESVDQVCELKLVVSRSRIGRYLERAYAYLSMTKRSIYVRSHRHYGQDGDRTLIAPVGATYLFVYPFVKTAPGTPYPWSGARR